MHNHIILRALLAAALVSTAGSAHAQITEGLIDYVGELAGEPPRNGHDKCKGNGHGGDRGGAGHEDGECAEEGEDAPGPVATEACYAVEQAPESAWQRYSCTLVTYNEDYVNDTVEANRDYPETAVEYAITSSETLTAATVDLLGGITEALPIVGGGGGGPIGPVGDDPLYQATIAYTDSATFSVERILGGDVAGGGEALIAATSAFSAGVFNSLPIVGGGGGGPIGPVGDDPLYQAASAYGNVVTTTVTNAPTVEIRAYEVPSTGF